MPALTTTLSMTAEATAVAAVDLGVRGPKAHDVVGAPVEALVDCELHRRNFLHLIELALVGVHREEVVALLLAAAHLLALLVDVVVEERHLAAVELGLAPHRRAHLPLAGALVVRRRAHALLRRISNADLALGLERARHARAREVEGRLLRVVGLHARVQELARVGERHLDVQGRVLCRRVQPVDALEAVVVRPLARLVLADAHDARHAHDAPRVEHQRGSLTIGVARQRTHLGLHRVHGRKEQHPVANLDVAPWPRPRFVRVGHLELQAQPLDLDFEDAHAVGALVQVEAVARAQQQMLHRVPLARARADELAAAVERADAARVTRAARHVRAVLV
eukprot:CAMPEP_0179975052 /NCGR_PEP_ID=MMETSP0983-20121128/38451_1 /TAXON_ID=483367 /ORGANISM="non described non described, Strain CCMP 2436" /LENGTH=336 /DNA_ID=CAMNT_0021891409 /DNA_START=427 /DNA_END=1438 /DNA_ORIENTATION=+